MPIATYSDLQAAIAQWLFNRTDLTSVIPTFISLAEADMNLALSVRWQEARVTTTFDTTQTDPSILALPSDFQSMRTIRVLGGPPFLPSRLTFMTQAQFEDKQDELERLVGVALPFPQFYSIYGSNVVVTPTPTQDYSVHMIYRQDFPALSDENPTNWLLSLSPNAYLYGSLMQAAPYLADDDRIQVWGAGQQKAIEALTKQSEEALYNGPLVMRTVRRRGY